MNREPMPSDARGDHAEQLIESAALYYAGALTPSESARFEADLLDAGQSPARSQADLDTLAECRSLERVMIGLVDSIPAVPPPPEVRDQLLHRTATAASIDTLPKIVSDNPQLEQLGIFIRRRNDDDWQEHQVPGLRFRRLYVDHVRQTQTVLLRMAPGARFPSHAHSGPEESLVLEGDLRIGDEILYAGDFQHAEPGSLHFEQWTESGCLVLVTSPLG